MSITKTLSQLSAGGGRPLSDTDLLKWANATVQKAKPSARAIRSFKDPSLTTGLFVLDLLDAIRPGIVDPALVIPVDENGPYEDRRQNGAPFMTRCVDFYDYSTLSLYYSAAKLAISIARKMNALIFLVPEDIVDIRPRLVRRLWSLIIASINPMPRS
jgi:plastin-1